MILNHLGQKEWLGFAWFSKSPLLSCFPICQEVLHLSKIIDGIPWNHTAMFHPCLIATVQQMSLRLFCFPLFCTVIRFGSMEYGVHGLHDKSSQDLPNSNEFSVQTIVYFTKARQTFAILCFPRIRFESIGSPNFVHRLRIGDCCEIHLHHWRHSAVIESPNVSARDSASQLRFPQRALELLARLHTSQFWPLFGKWQWILCFLQATSEGSSESESWEMFMSGGTAVSSRLSLSSSYHSGRSCTGSLFAWRLSSF